KVSVVVGVHRTNKVLRSASNHFLRDVAGFAGLRPLRGENYTTGKRQTITKRRIIMSSEATPLIPIADQGSTDERIMIINTAEMNPVDYDWGAIKWICDRKTTPNSQQSFGYAFLNPGGINPEHRHRTAEEIIYMLA